MDPSFSRALAEGFANAGIVPRLIADDPWQWRLGALTLVIKRGADTATLRYARVPVARGIAATAPAVLDAYHRVLDRLASESPPTDALHSALVTAYGTVAATAGVEYGRPVSIIDVHAELARGASGRYRRVQYAYDLARLRREHALSQDGERVDLGIATGGAAARKSRVLWIEDESGSGSYYSTLRILRVDQSLHAAGERGEP